MLEKKNTTVNTRVRETYQLLKRKKRGEIKKKEK